MKYPIEFSIVKTTQNTPHTLVTLGPSRWGFSTLEELNEMKPTNSPITLKIIEYILQDEEFRGDIHFMVNKYNEVVVVDRAGALRLDCPFYKKDL